MLFNSNLDLNPFSFIKIVKDDAKIKISIILCKVHIIVSVNFI